jgi:hypothetical protein
MPIVRLLFLSVVVSSACPALGAGEVPVRANPFVSFRLPKAWQDRFWADPATSKLLELDAAAVAKLVPVQAGLRFCRCPGCGASEAENTLTWSLERPDDLNCRRCGLTLPNATVPAKAKDKEGKDSGSEDVIEVLPGLLHKYPYHILEAHLQAYPDERLYLSAKRDDEAREFLAKAALYAAVRYQEQPAGQRDPALARLAAVLLLRFAQVYPAYAVHFDQPGEPKFFQRADAKPPYRTGYRSGKWDWLGCLDVPLNLVIAYALIRDDPALAEAGRALGDSHPGRTIERGLFRASAEFVLRQPDEFQEASLYAYRGLLAVGRLLDDERLVGEALARLEAFSERGFYHDGLWRQGDAANHQRVLALLDGWIDRLLNGTPEPVPMIALARSAGSAILTDPHASEIQQVAWPAPLARPIDRQPVLLGGAGLARLAVGQGANALDLELRGLGDLGSFHYNRLALRVSAGGRPVLGDLDDLSPSANGWEHATASHNAVVIDGLNQRESPAHAREPAPGSDVLFFAADADFQVATLEDSHAFSQSATRYRQTLIAVADEQTRYAVNVFEVHGGLQHDQLFHGPAGSTARWQTSVALAPGPATLLPSTITYLPTSKAEEGRWFVQAYGAFAQLHQGRIDRPAQALLAPPAPDAPGLRLHIFGDLPMSVCTGISPDPLASVDDDEKGRAVLVLRRRSDDGSTLKTTFVNLFEPVGTAPALVRAGRVASPPATVLLTIETVEGNEHLFVNLQPGIQKTVRLADGRTLATDGLAVRATSRGLVLAGGTYARLGAREVRQTSASGTIHAVMRQGSAGSLGWFETDGPVSDPGTLSGRVLLIHHGNGPTRGWTLARAVNTADGRARLYVREEPGFAIDPSNHLAHYYQFPRATYSGPHRFRVSKLIR